MIKRYDVSDMGDWGGVQSNECSEGDWCKWEDVELAEKKAFWAAFEIASCNVSKDIQACWNEYKTKN